MVIVFAVILFAITVSAFRISKSREPVPELPAPARDSKLAARDKVTVAEVPLVTTIPLPVSLIVVTQLVPCASSRHAGVPLLSVFQTLLATPAGTMPATLAVFVGILPE